MFFLGEVMVRQFLFRDLLTFRNSQLTKDLRYQARGNIKISVKRRMSYLKEAEPILIIVLKRTQAFPELAPCFGFPEAPLCLLSWSWVNLQIITHFKVENILKDSLDSIPSPSKFSENSNYLEGKFAWGVKTKKNCWALLTNYCIQKFVDNIQHCFVFTPFPPIIWIFTEVKVMGWNPGYLLKSLKNYKNTYVA